MAQPPTAPDVPPAPFARASRTVLDRLFDPHAIAVVGASADPAKRGFQALRALQRSGYPYPVYAVNPKGGSILGHDVLPRVEDLPPGVDVALLATPAPAVPGLLRACASVGMAGAVVLANGFREAGPGGAELERQVRAAVAETGIRVIGPNTSGTFVAATGANLVGLADVEQGPVSVVSQSGNMLLSLVNDARMHGGPGFDTYVGLGNQADVGLVECLAHLSKRESTRAIAIYLEGFKDGRELLAAAAQASRQRPLVMLRGGRSEMGRRAALSHTGSAAAPDRVAAAVLRQAGVELVDRSDELGVVAGALATCPPVRAGGGVAVLSDGGGHAGLAADALGAAGVPLAALSDATCARLRALCGPAAAVANPVDVAGATDQNPALFGAVASALAADPGVGLILVVGLFGGYHLRFDPALGEAEDRAAAQMADLVRCGMPLVVHSCYASSRPASHALLRHAGIPVLASLDHAVRSVAALARRSHFLATASQRSGVRLGVASPGSDRPPSAGLLDEPQGRRVLHEAGLDTGPWRLARTAAEAAAAVASYGGPCALRVVSPQVAHKSDVGGVRLDVTPPAAAAAYAALTGAVHAAVPDARIDGVMVTPMAEPGVELLVGATADPTFGPVVAFGSGGVLVDAAQDVAFRAAPCTVREAREMISETLAGRTLGGYRGMPAVDEDGLAAFIARVSEVVARLPRMRALDLNPVIAKGASLTAVDVRLELT